MLGDFKVSPSVLRGARLMRNTDLGAQVDAVAKGESKNSNSIWPQNVIDFASAAGMSSVTASTGTLTRDDLLKHIADNEEASSTARQIAGELRLPSSPVWKQILTFRAPTTLQDAVKAHGGDWFVHSIEEADGPLSLDYYSVHIDKFPKRNGTEMSAEELLTYIRTHINIFVDTDIAEFNPLEESEAKWQSSSPLGSLLRIDMKLFNVNVDDGCVVVARSTESEWVFSTIQAGHPLEPGSAAAHPVSGNRAFGFVKASSGPYVFYTIAADRTTRLVDTLVASKAYEAQDKLWRSFQQKLLDFVNNNEGHAKLGETKAGAEYKFNWDAVSNSDYFWSTKGTATSEK
jgi:hypothetical protein